MSKSLRSKRLNACVALAAMTVVAWSNARAAGPLPAAHDPAKTEETREKLARLARGMRAYHDHYKHFPPAVVLGPDGKTPQSWRVALLPFLGDDARRVYAQYKPDQPWDSPANKKLLDQMPDVFRSPYDDPKSTESAFYVLVGRGTVFEGSKGVKLSEIIDDASMTLLIVEARRNVPWTKPEDLAYDPKKPILELGGFVQGVFSGAMADGSSHTFTKRVRAIVLRGLIERNDGHSLKTH